jgi:arginase
MSEMEARSVGSADGEGGSLRLLCPQWQGAGTSSVQALAAEFPFEVARRGYAVGSAILQAILPPSDDGPTARVPITLGNEGLERVDGVEAKDVLVEQLASARAARSDAHRHAGR